MEIDDILLWSIFLIFEVVLDDGEGSDRTLPNRPIFLFIGSARFMGIILFNCTLFLSEASIYCK